MIYITHRQDSWDDYSIINSVYEVNSDKAKENYTKFLLVKAEELNLEINPHWHNALNYKDHNSHISPEEYKTKCKYWKKVLKEWTIEKYIVEVLGGKKLEYKNIY